MLPRRTRPPLRQTFSVSSLDAKPSPEYSRRRRSSTKLPLQPTLTSHAEHEELLAQEGATDESTGASHSQSENEEYSAQIETQKGLHGIHSVAGKGNIEELESLLASGVDVDEEDEKGRTALKLACEKGHLETVKILIQKGADVNKSDNARKSALHAAVRSDKEEIVSFLFESGAAIDITDEIKGRTPIHDAILVSNPRILQTMVDHIKDEPWEAQRILRLQDKDGQTALHLAAFVSNSTAVENLLSGGADVSALDDEGLTPLHAALRSHRKKRKCGGILSLLLEAGGDINVTGGNNNESLVHFAARVGCQFCLHFLRTKGADMEAKDKLGRTPLHIAANEREYEATNFLIENGANLETLTNDGLRPLHLAILGDSARVVDTLVKAGADYSMLGKDGITPIQVACIRKRLQAFQALVKLKAVALPDDSGEDIIHYCSALGSINLVTILLDQGWDINIRDSKRRTALQRSLIHGYEPLATFLINRDADLHSVDDAGATPLHYAVRWGGADSIVRLMLKKGVSLGIQDRLGRTPLHYAASKFSIMSDLYILLGGGSALDTQDNMGLTPLHLAARFGNESLVRILLDSGAKSNIQDVDGFLPIDHAKEKKNKSITTRLEKHELKINHSNTDKTHNSEEDEKVAGRMTHRKSVAW